MNRGLINTAIAALAIGVALTAPASAGFIVNFLPQPSSPGAYELIWDGMELYEGPGALGTGYGAGPGDGELPTDEQTKPGLLLETPFNIPGVLGSEVSDDLSATRFYDVTLDVIPTEQGATQGLVASQDALEFYGTVMQLLGGADFKIYSTDPDDTDEDNYTLLLAGTIGNAVITGLKNASTGATLSANVTYTDGVILNYVPGTDITGELSWSLADVTPALDIDPGTDRLVGFGANVVGQFILVPEPAALSIIALGGSFVLLRRKKRK